MNLLQINDKTVEGKRGILKVPLVRVGKWAHKAAKVIQFTISDLNQIIKNFRDNILQHKPYLTYGHVIEPYSYDSHRKKGDLIDMNIDGDILYGYFKANPSTYESVLNGDYEFASVEYVKDYMDPKTGNNVGMVLLRTALTNSPFLPGDIKIEALSQNPSIDRLFTTIPIASKNNINIMTDSTTQNLSNTATLERGETEVAPNNNNNNSPNIENGENQYTPNSISETSVESKGENQIQDSNVAPKEPSIDIASLKEEISQLKKQWIEAQELTKKILEQQKEINERALAQTVKQENNEKEIVESNKEVEEENKEKENKAKENDKEGTNEIEPEGEVKASQEVNQSTNKEKKDDTTPMNLNTELNKYVNSNSGPLDIKGLVQSIRDRVSSAYTAQLQDSQAMVQTLQQQLNDIKNQAEEERKQRDAYALSLQEAQNQAFLASTDLTRDHLIGNGVPPELANQFIQVQSGLLTQQSKINLSLDGQEPKELDITEALCELFIRAVSCNPVNLSVSGQSTFSGGTYDPTGRTQRIRQVIERNRKRAQELYK